MAKRQRSKKPFKFDLQLFAGIGPYTTGSLNVGKDLQIYFLISGVTYAYLGLLTETQRKVLAREHEVIPTNNDAIPVRRVTFEGYAFEFTLSRQNGIFDQLVQALQASYASGGIPPTVSMYETISNPDQSVNQTLYQGGTILPENLGTFKSTDPVADVKFGVKFTTASAVGGTAQSQVNLNAPASFL